MGCEPFHIGLLLWGSACCGIPQSKIKDFCQLPLAREPCGQWPLTISHGSFLLLVTSLTRPVSFYGAILVFFSLPIDSEGTKHSKIPQTQTGAEDKTHHPSQSEGSIPVGSTRGILKGGAIRAGASCSPLEPDNFPSFLAGARKEGPAGKRL